MNQSITVLAFTIHGQSMLLIVNEYCIIGKNYGMPQVPMLIIPGFQDVSHVYSWNRCLKMDVTVLSVWYVVLNYWQVIREKILYVEFENIDNWNLRFSQQWLLRLWSFGMWYCVSMVDGHQQPQCLFLSLLNEK